MSPISSMRMWAHAHRAAIHQDLPVRKRQETDEQLLLTIAGLLLALVAMVVVIMVVYEAMILGAGEIINLFDSPRIRFLWGIPV